MTVVCTHDPHLSLYEAVLNEKMLSQKKTSSLNI